MAEGKREHCVLKGWKLQYNKYELKFTKFGKWGVLAARGKRGT
jgi:hypothetical protein